MDKNSIVILGADYFRALSVKHAPREVEGRSFCSLTYRYSGKVTINAAGKELVSESDSVTFVPKGLSYLTEVIEDTEFIGIHFDASCESLPRSPIAIKGAGGAMRAMFESLLNGRGGVCAELSRTAMLYTLFAELVSRTENPAGFVPEKIVRARKMIEEGYSDPYFSIGELCRTLGVGTAYVRREFSASFGQSPINYLKELRIRCSKELLLSKAVSVAEVARLSGYTGVSYFIQDFKRAVGESPGEYRKRICFAP